MARKQALDSEHRKMIIEQMHEIGEITQEKVVDLIRQHYIFDPAAAKEQAMKRLAGRLMAQIRDESNVRTCFAIKDMYKQSVYVNVDKCDDVTKVSKVEKQLKEKYVGLGRSYRKAKQKRKELADQIKFEEAV